MSQFTIVTEDPMLMLRLHTKMMSGELIELEGVSFMPIEQNIENCKKLTLSAKSVEYVSVPAGTGRTSPGWTGDGLPPVGIDCETLWSSTTGEYVPVKVLAHDEDRAVVRFTAGSRKGEYDSDTQHNRYQWPIFRPLRTPEQIEADDRKKAIEEMMTYLGDDGDELFNAFGRMHDAGYRKFEGEA